MKLCMAGQLAKLGLYVLQVPSRSSLRYRPQAICLPLRELEMASPLAHGHVAYFVTHSVFQGLVLRANHIPPEKYSYFAAGSHYKDYILRQVAAGGTLWETAEWLK